MTARIALLALPLLVATATGCPPDPPGSWAQVSALSQAPLGEQASLLVTGGVDEEPTRTVTLSQGAALAISCGWDSQPCTALTSSDPAVLTTYRALSLQGSAYSGRFVLTGVSPGAVTISIASGSGTNTIRATVVP